LAKLVRRADAGEPIVDGIGFEEPPDNYDDDCVEEQIETLTEMICRVDEETRAARVVRAHGNA